MSIAHSLPRIRHAAAPSAGLSAFRPAFLAAALLCVSSPPARSIEANTVINDTARYLAGLEPSASSPLAPLTQEEG